MSAITVVAKIVANQDAIEPVKAELLKMIALTRQEPGCREYRLHQDSQDPAVFLFYENWDNLSCLEQHLSSTHYRGYVDAVADLIASKVVHKLDEITLR